MWPCWRRCVRGLMRLTPLSLCLVIVVSECKCSVTAPEHTCLPVAMLPIMMVMDSATFLLVNRKWLLSSELTAVYKLVIQKKSTRLHRYNANMMHLKPLSPCNVIPFTSLCALPLSQPEEGPFLKCSNLALFLLQ